MNSVVINFLINAKNEVFIEGGTLQNFEKFQLMKEITVRS
jgi:hypothetical protein